VKAAPVRVPWAMACRNVFEMISSPSALGWMWSTKRRVTSRSARNAFSMSASTTFCSRANARTCTFTASTQASRCWGARKS